MASLIRKVVSIYRLTGSRELRIKPMPTNQPFLFMAFSVIVKSLFNFRFKLYWPLQCRCTSGPVSAAVCSAAAAPGHSQTSSANQRHQALKFQSWGVGPDALAFTLNSNLLKCTISHDINVTILSAKGKLVVTVKSVKKRAKEEISGLKYNHEKSHLHKIISLFKLFIGHW